MKKIWNSLIILSVLGLLLFYAYNKTITECHNPIKEAFETDYFKLVKTTKSFAWNDDILIQEYLKDTTINNSNYSMFLQSLVTSDRRDTMNVRYYHYKKNKGNLYIYDKTENKDLLLFDSHYEIGKTWIQNDLEYKIISKSAQLATPHCNYKNLLQIQYTIPNGVVNHLYYKKGFGLVAVKQKDNLIAYLIK